MAEDREREVEAAVADIADPDRLLPGEDPSATDPEDVAHWRSVYEQLVAFKVDLVGSMERRMDTVLPAARSEIDRDLEIARAELDRLRARLSYWQAR